MTDTITTDLNPVPSRKSPSTFSSRMDTWLGKISTWTDEANALATGANTNKLAAEAAQSAAETAETHAETAETNAAASASEAESFAQTAINAPGTSATSTTSVLIGTGSKSLTIQTGKDIVVGMFVLIARTSAPENYMAGQVTSYNSETGALVVFVDSVGGSGTYTDWTISLSAITFDAATEAEMIAGTETAIRTMSPALVAAMGNARVDYQEFTSSGTWTKPTTAKYIYVEAIGGGGGGGSGYLGTGGGGGGGGGFTNRLLLASDITAPVSITIGAGGSGGTTLVSSNTDRAIGSDGGDSSFGSYVIAKGGKNGWADDGLKAGGGDGGGGELGTRPPSDTSNYGTPRTGGYSSGGGGGKGAFGGLSGANCVMGGAGGGYGGGSGGASIHGGNGGLGRLSSAAEDVTGDSGLSPGGGGGGAHTTNLDGYRVTAGDGGNGRLRIWSW